MPTVSLSVPASSQHPLHSFNLFSARSENVSQLIRNNKGANMLSKTDSKALWNRTQGH